MDKTIIQYYRKLADLYFCINKFINYNTNNNKTLYYVTLNTLTSEISEFNKIWKYFKDYFPKKYPGMAIGGVEFELNGNWHIHLLMSFDKEYAKSTISNVFSYARKIWVSRHNRVVGVNLSPKAVYWSLYDPLKGNKLTRYIAKIVKNESGQKSYHPKSILGGSFKRKYGFKDFWSKQELPSYRKSPKVLERYMKSVCNEYRKHLFTSLLLIEQNI